MWLLSTDRAELRFFSSLEQAQREGYAILSHVWGDVEQTFQETQALRKVGKPEDGYNPRDHSSPKVQMSCIVAELHGYRWIWNDTCCIDKTSSSELSEAINSMFSYYAHAEVCYVHLGDVPPDTPIRRYGSFAQSRWFRRGWTLQELVAPAQVIFLSSTWAVMGTKADHANALADITGIPKTIMTFEEEIWDVSIASRMSWASWRTTTRPEDEAYSLMGIFDVHMPTIYGEGRNAFRRLQEEIMRRSIDTTLFAWGEVSNFLPDREQIRSCNNGHDHNNMYLLATSPLDFRNCIRYQFAPKTERVVLLADKTVTSRQGTAGISQPTSPPSTIPSFEMTPYGVRARMGVVKLHGFAIAILCTLNHENDPLGVLLGECGTGDPTRPLYHPCVTTASGAAQRLVNVGFILRRLPKLQSRFNRVSWLEFYLTHVRTKPLKAVERNAMVLGTTGPFHVPSWLLAKLRAARIRVETRPKQLQVPWYGDKPVTLVAYHPIGMEALSISFGRCRRTRTSARTRDGTRILWVSIHYGGVEEREDGIPHDCSTDHFAEGLPTHKRVKFSGWYHGRALEIMLVFAPYPLSPTRTYVLTELEWKDELRTVPVFTTSG